MRDADACKALHRWSPRQAFGPHAPCVHWTPRPRGPRFKEGPRRATGAPAAAQGCSAPWRMQAGCGVYLNAPRAEPAPGPASPRGAQGASRGARRRARDPPRSTWLPLEGLALRRQACVGLNGLGGPLGHPCGSAIAPDQRHAPACHRCAPQGAERRRWPPERRGRPCPVGRQFPARRRRQQRPKGSGVGQAPRHARSARGKSPSSGQTARGKGRARPIGKPLGLPLVGHPGERWPNCHTYLGTYGVASPKAPRSIPR